MQPPAALPQWKRPVVTFEKKVICITTTDPIWTLKKRRKFCPFRKSNHDFPDQKKSVVTILTELTRLSFYNILFYYQHRITRATEHIIS